MARKAGQVGRRPKKSKAKVLYYLATHVPGGLPRSRHCTAGARGGGHSKKQRKTTPGFTSALRSAKPAQEPHTRAPRREFNI
jgi:hypothetical protein